MGRGLTRAVLAGVVIGAMSSVIGCGAAPTPEPSGSPPASPSPSPSPSPEASASPDPLPDPVPTFDRSRLSVDDPTSIWVVTDKLRPLNPIDYAPPDLVDTPVPFQNAPSLRAEAAGAMASMFATGAAEGAGAMTLQSAYRSYGTQVTVYNRYVGSLGRSAADAQSARPGHSEHQTGLAADISPIPLSCVLEACFGETPQGRWLADNSWRFGYILRYPADKTPVTGFIYEPWHFRYVGVELATEMRTAGIATLEEFFGLPAAPNYAG